MFKTILFCSLLLNAFSSVIEVNRENLTLENSFYFYAESEEEFDIEGLENFEILSSKEYCKKSDEDKNLICKVIHLKPKSIGDFHLKAEGSHNVVIHVFDSEPAPGCSIDISGVPSKVYAGEKFVLSYDLLSSREVAYAKFRPIKSQGIKVVHVEGDVDKCMRGFSKFNRFPIDKIIVYADEDKDIRIPSRTLDVEVLDTTYFHGHFRPGFVQSREIDIEIISLPEPDIEIVGKPNMEYSLNEDNGCVSIILTLYGNANLENVNSIYKSDDSFEVTEKSQHIEFISNGEYNAKKIFKIKIVPKLRNVVLPKREIKYFDTSKGTVGSLTLPEYFSEGTHINDQNSLWRLFSKGKGILWIVAITLLYLLIRYSIFGFYFNRGYRRAMIKIAKNTSYKECFAIFREAILKNKGLDISDQGIRSKFTKEISDKLSSILDEKENWKSLMLDILYKLK
ncbi:MAG TPA: hypothetical protein DEP20_00065 [Fusobacteria bacterium]|nr:hypothetical protein [Fusobacteriota bacterium]|tara:strand:+ start:8629 stop:9984 length:1356 start_codon:yes stop_codon:yes gene_type:complete